MTATTRPIGQQRTAQESVTQDGTVLNQVPPLTSYNLFLSDSTLARAVHRDAAWAHEHVSELGRLLGTEQAQGWGFDANENPPVLHTHDRYGNRRDEVVFHPSWHELMRTSVEHRLHSLPWLEKRKGAHVARAAMMMLTAQNEAGHTCPISMTFSAVAALRAEPALVPVWEPKILPPVTTPNLAPGEKKGGGLAGGGRKKKGGASRCPQNSPGGDRPGH